MSKTLVIGTIAGVLLVFILGGIFLWQQSRPAPEQPAIQQIPPPAPSQTPESNYDETLYEGWTIYTDAESGYSLRVPPNWIHKEFIEPHADDYFRVAFGTPDGVLLYIEEREAYKVYEFGCTVVSVTPIPSKFSVEGAISQILDIRSELNDAVRMEVLAGSQRAVQFDESIFPFDPRYRNPQLDGFTTFVKHAHNNMVLMFASLSCETEKEQFKNLYEMMLASVQFFEVPQQAVEQPVIDTTTWQLYTHPEFGYSLRMHPAFQGRSDAERFLVLTDENKSCRHTQDLETKKWIAVELDINIFTYGASNFSTSREESKRLYQKLLDANSNTELTEDGTVILKIENFNLDGRLLPQVLVGGNTYSTFYAGDHQAFHFELEGDCPDDVEKYRLLLNEAFPTFRFNNFDP